jgi:hypothetical protein
MSEISDIIDGFERLTEVAITMDVEKMRKDGMLHKAGDVFFAMIKNRMVSTNATDVVLTCDSFYEVPLR